MKKILKMLASIFMAFAHAEVTTAVVNGGESVKFTDGVRMVYSKQIEF